MALNTMCTTSPLVSVVVASYNRLDSLLWLLNDLREQKPIDGAFEVVVVDDGSSQAVAPEVNSRTFSFDVRVLTQANRGPAVARDVGIGEARGEWIVIVDDDMVLPETFLSAHMAAHTGADKNPPADVVLGHIRGPADATGLALFERFHQFSLDRFVAAHQNGSLSLDGGRLCTGNVSFRKADYLAVGGFDLALGRLEDRELGIRFESANYSLVFSVDAWNEHRSDHDHRQRQGESPDELNFARRFVDPLIDEFVDGCEHLFHAILSAMQDIAPDNVQFASKKFDGKSKGMQYFLASAITAGRLQTVSRLFNPNCSRTTCNKSFLILV